MAKNLDGLIDHLLEEIALCGAPGVRPSDVLRFINDFYEEQDHDGVGNGDEEPKTPTNPSKRLSVDRALQETVWKWLARHPEIRIGSQNEGRHLTLTEAEAFYLIDENQQLKTKPANDLGQVGHEGQKDQEHVEATVVPVGDEHGGQRDKATKIPSVRGSKQSRKRSIKKLPDSGQETRIRVYTTEERSWVALTGHAPDPSRVTSLDFGLLSIIGSQRHAGILQPSLSHVSGQDLRSVPTRVQRLRDNGYIEIRKTIGNGMATSMLYLKRYAPRAQMVVTVPDVPGYGNAFSGSQESNDIMIDHGALTEKLFDILREFKLITFNDLKRKLGVFDSRWLSKRVAIAIRQFELVGFLRRVRAPGNVGGHIHRCVQLLREPKKQDLTLFEDNHPIPPIPPIPANKEEDADADGERDEDYQAISNTIIPPEGIQGTTRIIAQWTPDRCMTNLFGELIHSSGTRGMSTMAIKEHGIGDFSRRPQECVLSKLTDAWYMSQPIYLRHLAIIRDTTSTGRNKNYVYYSFENFQRLVAENHTSWEAIIELKGTKKGSEDTLAILEEKPDVDQYGFPRIPAALFQGQNGSATLRETVQASKVPKFPMTKHVSLEVILENESSGIFGEEHVSVKRGPATRPSSGDVMRPTNRSKPPGRPATRAPKRSRLTATQVKQKRGGKSTGRPRKFHCKGLPHNLDQMTKNQLQQLDLSRRHAMEYRVKTDIARRVKDGQDPEQAREEVAVELKEYANVYSEDRTAILQALNKFGVVPVSKKRKAKVTAKTAPPIPVYMPSMVAHTFPLVLPPSSRGNSTDSVRSVAGSPKDLPAPVAPEALISSVFSEAARLMERPTSVALMKVDEQSIPADLNSSDPGKGKRFARVKKGSSSAPRIKTNAQDLMKHIPRSPVAAPYLPSMVAHTIFNLPSMSIQVPGSIYIESTDIKKAKTTKPQIFKKKPKFQYLPSMYAHTWPVLATTNVNKAKPTPRKESESTLVARREIGAKPNESKKKNQGLTSQIGFSLATETDPMVASLTSLITAKNSSSQIVGNDATSAGVGLPGVTPTPHNPLISSIAPPVLQISDLLSYSEGDLDRSLTNILIPNLEPLKPIDVDKAVDSHTSTPTAGRKRRRVHKIVAGTEASPPADNLISRKKRKYTHKSLPLKPAVISDSNVSTVNHLPSMIAHTQPLLRYSAQDVSAPATVRNPPMTKWSAAIPMTYNQQRQALGSLPSVGIFVGLDTTIKRASKGRPKKSRLLVFKSARLREFDWFIENGPMEPAATAAQAILLAEVSKSAGILNSSGLPKPAKIGATNLENMVAKSINARRPSIMVSEPAEQTVSPGAEIQPTVLHEAGSNVELHQDATGHTTSSSCPVLEEESSQAAHSDSSTRPLIPSAVILKPSTRAQDASINDKQPKLVGNNYQCRQVQATSDVSNTLNASPIKQSGTSFKNAGSALEENTRKRKDPPTILSQSELIKTATAILMKKRRISPSDSINSNSSSSVMLPNSVANNATLREQKSINPTPQSSQINSTIQPPKAAHVPRRGALPLVAEPLVDTMLISEPTAPKPHVEIPVIIENSGVLAQTNASNLSIQTDSNADSISSSALQATHNTEEKGSTPAEDAINLSQDDKESVTKGAKASSAQATTTKSSPSGRVVPAGGTISFKRKKIILDILDKCGGVFPGGRELWYPFATAWQAQGNTSKPDEKTIKATKKALIDVGRIRQLKFSFVDKCGAAVTKNIITAANMPPTDPKVHDLQKRMIERDPKIYIPEEVEVSESLKPHDRVVVIDPAVDKQAVVQLHYLNPSIQRVAERRAATAERRQERILKQQEKANRRQAAIEAAIDEELGEPDFMIEGYQDDEFVMASGRDGLVRYRARLPGARSRIGPESRVRRLAQIVRLPGSSAFQIASLSTPSGGHTILTQGAGEDPSWQNIPPVLLSNVPYDRPVRFANPLGLRSNFDSDMEYSPEEEIDEELVLPEIDRVWREFSTLMLPPFAIGTARPSRPSSNSPTGSSRDPSLADTDTELQHEAIKDPPKKRHFEHATPSTFDRLYEYQQISTIMDPDHVFHTATGTFSTRFQVLRNARLDLWVTPPPDPSLSMLPYSLYDLLCRQRELVQPEKHIDACFRTLRNSRQAFQSQFENDIDKVLDWELKTEDLDCVRSADWRFINHQMPHGHVQADYSAIDMDVIYGRKNRVPGLYHYFGRRVHSTHALSRPIKRLKSRVQSATVTFPSVPAKRRLPEPKIRRLTSIAQKASASQSQQLDWTTHIDSDGRIVKKTRSRAIADHFGRENEKRLMVAVCAIRVLTGGLNRAIDWKLVARLFDPKFGEGTVLKCWQNIIKASKYQMDKMEVDFQELFIQAYEKNEIASIDFADLENYDWNKLVDWAQERLEDPEMRIPASRYWNAKKTANYLVDLSCYNEQYDLRELPESDFQDFYGKALAQQQYTSLKRVNALNQRAFVEPLQPRLDPPTDENDAHYLALLRTWIRANVITPTENYSPDLARRKFTSLPLPAQELEGLTNRAIRELLKSHVLMQENRGRLIPGRNYDVTEQLLKGLRKTIDAWTFKRATAFKLQLDAALTNKGTMGYSHAAADGDTLVVLNLQAHGRIKLVPQDVPMNEFGLLDGNYKSRFMDKKRLNFPIEIRPTAAYIYGHPLHPLAEPPNQHLGREEAKIPIWYDLFGNLVPVIWEMLLAATMTLVATRSGIVARELVRCLSPGVEEWEVEVLMEWCEGVGLVKKRGSGWLTQEWWWSCLWENEDAGMKDDGR